MHATDKEVHAPQPLQVLVLGDRNALAEALALRLTLLGADVKAAAGTDSEIGVVLKQTDWAGIGSICDAHELALATRLKGDPTCAPTPGLLTVMPSLLPFDVDSVTVMATSVSQAAPPLPHALTCSVWAPTDAGTCALRDAPATMVVSLLSSSE